MILLVPFNIFAYDEFNLGYFDCVNFFKYRNLDFVASQSINLSVIEEGYNINVPRHNINAQTGYSNVAIPYVYNLSNGQRLGYFVNFIEKDPTNNGTYDDQAIRFLKTDGTYGFCNNSANGTKCFISLDPPDNSTQNYFEAAHTQVVQSHNSIINGTIDNTSFISFMSGTYTSYNSFQSGKGNYINDGDVLHLIFMIPSSQVNQNITTFTSSINYFVNTNGLELYFSGDSKLNGGYRIYDINITSNISGYFWLNLNSLSNKSVDIFPIFFGYVRNMSRDIYTSLYGDNYAMWMNSINDAIANGSNDSNNSVDNNDTINDNLQNTTNQYNQLDSQFNNTMNNNLDNFNTDNNLFNDQKFINSGNFIKDTFDTLIGANSYISTFITLVLCIGVASLFFGRGR